MTPRRVTAIVYEMTAHPVRPDPEPDFAIFPTEFRRAPWSTLKDRALWNYHGFFYEASIT